MRGLLPDSTYQTRLSLHLARARIHALRLLGAAACLVVGCYQPHRLADDFGSYNGNAVASNDGGTHDGGHDSHHSGSNGDGDTSSKGDGDTSSGHGDGDTSSGGDGDHSILIDAGHAQTDAGHTPSTPHPTTLEFSVRTVELGGRFAPRNIGAIWVESSSGSFVKTLALWARTRERYLVNFLDATNGDTTDAITSATLNSQQTHDVSWDLTDSAGQSAPDGDYRIRVEMTDDNGEGDVTSISFTKGATPQTMSPSDTQHFVSMSLDYR
jgi:hypothetical protein